MDNMDLLNTPVAFFFIKNGVYITKLETKVVDPSSLYELQSELHGVLREHIGFKSTPVARAITNHI